MRGSPFRMPVPETRPSQVEDSKPASSLQFCCGHFKSPLDIGRRRTQWRIDTKRILGDYRLKLPPNHDQHPLATSMGNIHAISLILVG